MSIDSNQDQVVITGGRPDEAEPAPPEAHAAPVAPQAPVATHTYVPAVEAAPANSPVVEHPQASYAQPYQLAPSIAVAEPPPSQRTRPKWAVAAAVAVVGLIASGSLGYLFFSTNTKLESTRQALTATKLDLDGKNTELTAEHDQAAYVRMFTNDLGRTSADYSNVSGCDSYSSCRSAAQAALSDTQSFQADRQTAKVPANLTSVDSMLGDGLSAYIAALRDLISAIASNNMDRVQSAFNEVNDAMLSVFKSQSALANLIQ